MNTVKQVLEIQHDIGNDSLIIDGVKYAGEFFRSLCVASPGMWLRIEERRNGALDIFAPDDKTSDVFDRIVERGHYSDTARLARLRVKAK